MKKRIKSHIVFMITVGYCSHFFAMDTKAIPTFTVNRVIEIEPHDYALDPKKPTIKNISFMGENKEKLLIYEATQIKRNVELTIILRSSHTLNYVEWQTKRSPLFLDVYDHSTNEQMFFKYIHVAVESVPQPIIPPIYRSIERTSDGTTTFIKAYPVSAEEKQTEPPKTIRSYISIDTPEDSDSILGRESDDDFLDQLAAQQKKQKEIAQSSNTHSFLAPIIVASAAFITVMVMLYKSDRLPESFTQFINTLKNPLLRITESFYFYTKIY